MANNKLYEATNVQKTVEALRKKIKEYYTYPKDNKVDDVGTDKNFDGKTAKDFVITTESYDPQFVYNNLFKIADVAPADASLSPQKANLGVLHLVSRLGFPDDTSMDFSITSGSTKVVPDNGWVCAYTTSATPVRGGYIVLTNESNGMTVRGDTAYPRTGDSFSSSEGTIYNRKIYISIPCSRYDKVNMSYKASLPLSTIFIPAKKTNKNETDEINQYAMAAEACSTTTKITVTSGSSISAPSDGWLVYLGAAVADNYCLFESSNGMKVSSYYDAGLAPYCFMPVARGQSATVTFNGGTIYFLKAYKS